MTASASMPPGRAVLRTAGILTQVCSASCLLLGTIAFVLVQQNATGGAAYVIAWSAAALLGLVAGGLMGRGGMKSLIASALLDAGFGVVLLALDAAVLRGLVQVLPASDVAMIGQILLVAGGAMLAVAALCLAAIPQALRRARWLHAQALADDAAGAAQFPGADVPPGAWPAAPRAAYPSGDPGYPGYPVPGAAAPPGPPLHATVPPGLGATRPSRPGALRADEPDAAATARGWAPPTAKITVWNLPAATAAERRSRRRLYLALAGFAIGFGTGIGVLVSTAARDARAEAAAPQLAATAPIVPGAGSGVAPVRSAATPAVTPDAVAAGSADPGPVGGGGALEDAPSIERFVEGQRVALAAADRAALAAMLAPTVFGFGADADQVADTRADAAAHVLAALGPRPATGFTIEPRFVATGAEGTHAWIAMELAVVDPDGGERRFAVTELAALGEDGWTILAWHWAVPVPDATAERGAILGTLPRPAPVRDVVTAPAELAAAARAAFGSRAAFVAARSERPDGFNFGSAPNERVVGGARVKRVFAGLRAEIRVHDGMRIHAVSPTVGYAAANVDFRTKTRAATDLTQTFRVLAVFVKDGAAWQLVQTQWSHGGPIR